MLVVSRILLDLVAALGALVVHSLALVYTPHLHTVEVLKIIATALHLAVLLHCSPLSLVIL